MIQAETPIVVAAPTVNLGGFNMCDKIDGEMTKQESGESLGGTIIMRQRFAGGPLAIPMPRLSRVRRSALQADITWVILGMLAVAT